VKVGNSAIRLAALALPLAFVQTYALQAWHATGPFGGDAELVRVVPKVKGSVIAASRNGLMFSSTNGGAFWNPISFPGEFVGVLHALEVDPRSEKVWYAGVESENSWMAGVWKTSDAGRTWTLVPETKGLSVWSLAVWAKNPDVVAAGTGTGVFLTRDGAATWQRISREGDPELRPVVSLAFHPSDANTLYAGTTHLPWKTTDGGKTWQQIHEGMIDDSDVFSINVDTRNPDRVFASACSGLYGSTNAAAKWAKLATPPGAFRTYFVAIHPQHPETVFAGTTEGLMRSTDGGRTWRKVSNEAIRSVAFDPWVEGRIFFASSSAGLMVSSDGGASLHESNYGFANRNFTTLTGSGGILYSSSVFEPVSGGVYRTDNLGLRWARAGEQPGDQLLTMASSAENPKLIAAVGYRGIFESTDGGKLWTSKRVLPPGSRVTAVLPFSGTVLVAGTDTGLFRSSADGWSRLADGEVKSIGRSGSTAFAITATGAYKSGHPNAGWTRCGEIETRTGTLPEWYSLSFDSAASTVALAETSLGVYRSTDGCRSWTAVREGLQPGETASLVLFHPTRAGEAYASQGGRVFMTSDGGAHWEPLDDDAPSHSGPSSLFILPATPDRLFALYPRRGVFSTPLSGGVANKTAGPPTTPASTKQRISNNKETVLQ
jgi:photosystem II stability/assembly factor-like uncharacterized protein